MDLHDKKILIIKPSSLGDIIHTLPLVHALKRCAPGCSIGWVVQESFAAIPANDPAVEMVHTIDITSTSDPQAGRSAYWQAFTETVATLLRLRRIFRQQPYDLVLDLHASFRSGLIGLANPGGVRIGFRGARELNPLFQHQQVRIPDTHVHALEKNLLFGDYLGCPAGRQDYFLYSGNRADRAVDDFLAGREGVSGKRIVYLNPAARWKTKFWHQERWAALADRLLGDAGVQVVFGGSRKDTTYISSIVRSMIHTPIVAAGCLDLAETASLLKRSAVYVGLDSGPMHMAAMAGIGVVALFGPTHPERVGPYGVAHVIVRDTSLDCLGCRKRMCSHLSCMEGISVDMVYEATARLLDDQTFAAGNQ